MKPPGTSRSEAEPRVGASAVAAGIAFAITVALAVTVAASSCGGDVGPPGGGPGPGAPTPGAPVGDLQDLSRPDAFGSAPLLRLTRAELGRSLVEVFGVDPGAALLAKAPEDIIASVHFPFSNDHAKQGVNDVVVEKYNTFAESYGPLVARSAHIARLAGCTPTGPLDGACFEKLIARLAPKALRRPVSVAEIQAYAGLLSFAMKENDFTAAVDLLVQALVQSPELLYRLESVSRPAGAPGLYRLDSFEIATRMSFLVWGSGPDDELLAAAQDGLLVGEAGRLKQLDRMVRNPKVLAQWQRFHGEWLGYEGGAILPPTLAADMVAETNDLVAHILRTNRPWMNLLTAGETFATPALARHYGLPAPAAAGDPVTYEGGRGGGLLAHASFLVHGSKFGDTSPTLRGNEILTRLMCFRTPPPPVAVDTDQPPQGPTAASCKPERYSMRNLPDCRSCHALTDELGFGLENYSPLGQWRTTEPMLPSCSIDGTGTFAGQAFSGPRALGQLLAQRPEVGACASLQIFRFMKGRRETDGDQRTVNALHERLRLSGTLASLVTALVQSPAIAHKVTP